MFLLSLFKYFFNLGLTANLPNGMVKQIKLTNQITVFMLLSAVPYYAIFYKLGLQTASNMVLTALLIYCIILCLNAKKMFQQASFLIILSQSIIILPFFSIYLGFESGAHLMYIPLSILPLILYPNEENRLIRISGHCIIFLSIIFSTACSFFPIILSVEIPLSTAKLIYISAFFATFGLVLPQVSAFNRSEQKATKKLEKSNFRLSKALLQLKESKEMQKHLRQYADYARLVQRIAHEFKNPLQMLQGSAELGLVKRSNHNQLFKVILESVDRLNHLIQPMLTYLSSKQNYKFKSFNIIKTLDDIVMLSKANCKARQIKVKMMNKMDNPMVEGDSKAIGQVFINLLSNAIDAIGDNGGEIKIELINESFLYEGTLIKGVRINIIDNGCGIEADSLKKIFVPYETSKSSQNNVGLGLSIVSKIIQDHSGLIKINSAVNEYTMVSIWLNSSLNKEDEPIKEEFFELSYEFFEKEPEKVKATK